MGGRDKGLLPWQGRPMIAWLHDVVRPLTDDLIISCNRNQQAYEPYADRLVRDSEPAELGAGSNSVSATDFQGPLAGIRAAMQVARHEQLLVLPCDAPRIDHSLIDELLALAGERPVMAQRGGYWEPLFALLPCALLASLEQAWEMGQRSPQRWLQAHDPLALICAEDDPRLCNVNTPHLLE